ncbi:MAG: hypothetical protein ACJ0BH_05200 [Candidatus Puniceispirillaceae bacterium]
MIRQFSQQKLDLFFWGIKETKVWENPDELTYFPDAMLKRANPIIHGHVVLFQVEKQLYGMKKDLINLYKNGYRWKSHTKKLLEGWLSDMDYDSKDLFVCFFKKFDEPNARWTFYIQNAELRVHLKQVFEKNVKGRLRKIRSYSDLNYQGEEFPILPFVNEFYPKWYNENHEREEKFERRGGDFGESLRVHFWLFAGTLAVVFFIGWLNS